MFDFRSTLDVDQNGKVDLGEAFQQAPQILAKLYEKIPQGPHDWCEMTDENGNIFYYNKRVGSKEVV